MKKLISLYSVIIFCISLFTNVFLFAQQDSSTKSILKNHNTKITPINKTDLKKVLNNTLKPLVQINVQLSASRYKVQMGEVINLIASLTPQIPGATYRFYLENSNWTTGFLNQNQIYLTNLNTAGTYIYGVEVRFLPQTMTHVSKPLILNDTIKIQVDSIDIDVHPELVEVGNKVSFDVGFNTIAENVKCRFFYGKNIQQSEWNGFKSNFIYKSPGIYVVHAEVGMFDGDHLYASYQTREKIVRVAVPPNITISINKTNPQVGEDIIFTAFSNIQRRDIKYIFYLGKEKLVGNQGRNSIKYIFNKAGNYTVRVELLTLNNQLLADAFKNIEVYIGNSFPNWLLYVLIALGLILLATAVLKWFFKPSINLYPKSDLGKQSLSNDKMLSVDLEFRLKFDLHDTRYQVSTKGSKIIESIRRI